MTHAILAVFPPILGPIGGLIFAIFFILASTGRIFWPKPAKPIFGVLKKIEEREYCDMYRLIEDADARDILWSLPAEEIGESLFFTYETFQTRVLGEHGSLLRKKGRASLVFYVRKGKKYVAVLGASTNNKRHLVVDPIELDERGKTITWSASIGYFVIFPAKDKFSK